MDAWGYEHAASIIRWVFPILVLNLVPAPLIALAWVCYLRRRTNLSVIRKVLFICGLLTGTIASVLLLVFLRMIILHPSSVGHVNERAGTVLLVAFVLALIGTLLAFSGRGKERFFTIACGVSLTVLLYEAGMATSI
jgi:hypothetical protein